MNARTIALSTLILLCSFIPNAASAYSVEKLPQVDVVSDFVVGPGKTEMTLSPGDEKTVNLMVTNRMGEEKTFRIEIEDFAGSHDISQTVVLLGDERGPYSLKDYLRPDVEEFTLQHGERATIPVKVKIPADAEPGGRYGSVVVSTVTKSAGGQSAGAAGGAAIVSRIGTLFFVTVSGDAETGGSLTEFKTLTGKRFYTSGPIDFQLLYENTGSVHVNPYGEIRITNIFGEEVGAVVLDPWFSLPDSLRLRQASWNRNLLFGMYTATARVNRGYDDIIDEKQVTFFVIPWKITLGVCGLIAVILVFVRFVASKFEIKRK